MNERYGKTPVSEIRELYNRLRKSIRSMDLVAADEALTDYEPFADYIFQAQKEMDNVQD